MSTDTITPLKKPHSITCNALCVVYLRNALNNPAWTSGIEDWQSGFDSLRSIPRIFIPKGMTDDVEIFTWSVKNQETFALSDAERDTCRKALKKSFEQKTLPVNEAAFDLVNIFSLKS